MSKGNSFHEYIMNGVFQGIEGLSSRSMFGGFGIYKDGVFFALISDGELYFKVGDDNKEDYNKTNSKPFVYTGHKGKDVTLSYWLLQEEIMENKDKLIRWIDKAVEASIKSKKK